MMMITGTLPSHAAHHACSGACMDACMHAAECGARSSLLLPLCSAAPLPRSSVPSCLQLPAGWQRRCTFDDVSRTTTTTTMGVPHLVRKEWECAERVSSGPCASELAVCCCTHACGARAPACPQWCGRLSWTDMHARTRIMACGCLLWLRY